MSLLVIIIVDVWLQKLVKSGVTSDIDECVGLDSISMDLKEKKLTVTGDIDPVALVSKLRKVYHTEIVSVGPVKEPEKKDEANKKKDEPNKKKDEPNKDQNKKGGSKDQAQVGELVTGFYRPTYYIHYPAQSMEEDPNSCVISWLANA